MSMSLSASTSLSFSVGKKKNTQAARMPRETSMAYKHTLACRTMPNEHERAIVMVEVENAEHKSITSKEHRGQTPNGAGLRAHEPQ
jgi:hypothetical protein